MTKGEALYEYFNGFMQSFRDTSVPDDVQFPWLTYQYADGSLYDMPTSITVNIWDHTESEAVLDKRATDLRKYIEDNNEIAFDGGYIEIYTGEPYCQAITAENDRSTKGRYINLYLLHINR